MKLDAEFAKLIVAAFPPKVEGRGEFSRRNRDFVLALAKEDFHAMNLLESELADAIIRAAKRYAKEWIGWRK